MSAKRHTRRQFLGTAAAGGAALWTGLAMSQEEKKSPPSERLQVGVIGVAGQGESDTNEIAAGGADIVALCDVDEKRAGGARQRYPGAAFHTDFRRLLDQKGLDAVLVATPDHLHAIATLAALRAGLHVYCEKPLTHTVEEARRVAETAARQKRVTQMGTQIHGGSNYRRVVELVQGGAIGSVREVHVWCGTSYPANDRPKETPAVPEGLHWDLWLGPAPERPYHPCYVPFNWRGWWDFGGGAMTDMACHYMDLPFWALKLRHPERVAAEGPPLHSEGPPPWLIVRYQFPARESLPPVELTWYDGGKRPAVAAEHPALAGWGSGVLFMGEKGRLAADYGRHVLLPEEKFAGFERPKPTIPDSIGHYREWVQACKTGGPTTCNFDYAGALTEAVLLGDVSYRSGRPLEWKASELKIPNAPEAERYLRKEYRKPWTI